MASVICYHIFDLSDFQVFIVFKMETIILWYNMTYNTMNANRFGNFV